MVLARVGGEPAGFAYITKWPIADDNTAHLDDITVTPAMRKLGLATMMLGDAARWLDEDGIQHLVGKPISDALRPWFLRLGFDDNGLMMQARVGTLVDRTLQE